MYLIIFFCSHFTEFFLSFYQFITTAFIIFTLIPSQTCKFFTLFSLSFSFVYYQIAIVYYYKWHWVIDNNSTTDEECITHHRLYYSWFWCHLPSTQMLLPKHSHMHIITYILLRRCAFTQPHSHTHKYTRKLCFSHTHTQHDCLYIRSDTFLWV